MDTDGTLLNSQTVNPAELSSSTIDYLGKPGTSWHSAVNNNMFEGIPEVGGRGRVLVCPRACLCRLQQLAHLLFQKCRGKSPNLAPTWFFNLKLTLHTPCAQDCVYTSGTLSSNGMLCSPALKFRSVYEHLSLYEFSCAVEAAHHRFIVRGPCTMCSPIRLQCANADTHPTLDNCRRMMLNRHGPVDLFFRTIFVTDMNTGLSSRVPFQHYNDDGCVWSASIVLCIRHASRYG